jgi:phosphoenolpyruvate carboxykinase (ATP)
MNHTKAAKKYIDASSSELIQQALDNGEVELSANGAIVAVTGDRTGRSPKDRFIVSDHLTETAVDWGAVNQPIADKVFADLWQRAEEYLKDKTTYVSHLRAGADNRYGIPVTVTTEWAWHNVFCQNLLIREQYEKTSLEQPWNLLSAPGFICNPTRDGVNSDGAVLLNFTEKKILIVGMRYAGEMKKSVFSVLNFLLPEQGVLPMHCAANLGKKGDVALFFGLSGTGKTTLSADPDRFLIGDDEHGWSADSVFNFEGGCYAKCIDLSKESEPVIWDAIKSGAIMENVVLGEDKLPDFTDVSLTKNTRAAYPREHIPLRVEENKAGTPEAVIFLTCDLYGVLPPVAVLTIEQAAYYFLSGYTALVGSTEVGSTSGIMPTFSTCFGAPFFPRAATVYADLLMKRVKEPASQVYLVNTGWTGGAYGKGGKRFSIPTTRRIVDAIVKKELSGVDLEQIEGFNFSVPKNIEGIDSKLLNPVNAWASEANFEENSRILISQFKENFKQYDVSDAIKKAGPV